MFILIFFFSYSPDNLYNYAPKLMAEANRPDGFRVLSLGYAEGPGISYETLFGRSTGMCISINIFLNNNSNIYKYMNLSYNCTPHICTQ